MSLNDNNPPSASFKASMNGEHPAVDVDVPSDKGAAEVLGTTTTPRSSAAPKAVVSAASASSLVAAATAAVASDDAAEKPATCEPFAHRSSHLSIGRRIGLERSQSSRGLDHRDSVVRPIRHLFSVEFRHRPP
jgi:hypothetical protein